MRKNTKRAAIIKYLTRNPNARVVDVAKKFEVTSATVYVAKRSMVEALRNEEREDPPFVVESVDSPATRSRQEGGDHYINMSVQPWDVVDCWTDVERIAFYRGNALKYLMRMGYKDAPAMDALKARHYVERMVEVLRGEASAK